MKLLTYRRNGTVRHGYRHATDDVVHELGEGDLGALVGHLGNGWTPPRAASSYAMADVQLEAPLLRPGKLLAVAANYQDHVTEAGGEPLDKSSLAPRLFLKPPTTIAAPGADIPMPSISTQVDWEAELVVVIGRGGKDISEERALAHVAGYSVGNDVSARSLDYGYARDTSAPAVGFFDWLAGKWPDGFCPFGPYLVTAEGIDDPQNLEVSLEVNGVLRQQGNTRDMIFGVAELVSFAARLMTLEPGDVLLTGTPAGVGAATGEFLTKGDEMTVRIAGLGELVNRIV